MREFLEEAHEHREDGYGRAQAHAGRQLPKRFYKIVDVAPIEGGFGVTLDGKTPRTPGMKIVSVPHARVAEVMAAEWRTQEEFIDPMTMPVTRIVNSAVEAGPESVPALRDEIIKYASNDLMLYRAETPESLVRRQEAVWDPVLVELARHFGIAFQPTFGIVHQAQPVANAVQLAGAIAERDLFTLTALNVVTSITGSGLLAIALLAGVADRELAWTAAHVDEDHNISLWGEVEEITTRRAQRRRDFDAAVNLLEMFNAKS